MSKPTAASVRPDADEAPVTPEVVAELRRRLETLEDDAKAARAWPDVRGPKGPLPAARLTPLTQPVRLSSLARWTSSKPASACETLNPQFQFGGACVSGKFAHS